MSYAGRAKQWFRSPSGMVTTEAYFSQPDNDMNKNLIRAESYFVSPEGAPENYGYLAPMTVRSVGFGLMPVEATVQVSQRRSNGYPIPLKAWLRYDYERIPRPPGVDLVNVFYREVNITDSFNVQILSVRVDGVDVGLNGNCRTVEPAPVIMTSPEYYRADMAAMSDEDFFRSMDPSTYFHPTYGGELRGTMTIPPFTGCTTTAGDDLSNLLTLSASGPDNPVIGRAGFLCNSPIFEVGSAIAPAPPGISNPKKAGCPGPKPFQYPERDD